MSSPSSDGTLLAVVVPFFQLLISRVVADGEGYSYLICLIVDETYVEGAVGLYIVGSQDWYDVI